VTHPDLDYHDTMPLDELVARTGPLLLGPITPAEWLLARRAVRDFVLDLAEEMDERGEVVVIDLDRVSPRGEYSLLAAYRDYDHG